MNKLFTSVLLCLMTALGANAQDAETTNLKEVVHYSFDNNRNPYFEPTTRVSESGMSYEADSGCWDRSHNLNGKDGKFFTYQGNYMSYTSKVPNGILTFDILPGRDLAAEGVPAWQLDYDMAFYNGCGDYARHNILKAGDEELLNIECENNWGDYATLRYNNGTNSVELYAVPCDRMTRTSVSLIDAVFAGNNALWYHFALVGCEKGVYLTVQRYDKDGVLNPDSIVLNSVKVSEKYVTPTSMTLEANSLGAVGLDEMTLQVFNNVKEIPDVEHKENTTMTQTVEAGSQQKDSAIYDMKGSRLTRTTGEGIYIMNKKKVLVK